MPGHGNSTLVINAGSSSVKFRAYRNSDIVIDGVVDRIGREAVISFTIGERYVEKAGTPVRAPTYNAAGAAILKLVAQYANLDEISLVVHRVVHGGDYEKQMVVTPGVLKRLHALIPLAPLHQPQSLDLIHFFMTHTKARQIACFDTMFHRTMPAVAKTYALPQALVRKYDIQRFGFHGLSHASLLCAAEKEARSEYRNVITCQLGNGISLCAIKNGKSIDTTMGFTPLEGLPMGTRSGNIDPAIVAFLCKNEKQTPQQVLEILEHESGLKALAGASDIRDILTQEKRGNKRARFALEFFGYNVRKQIGAYMAALSGVDAIVLGGGIARAPEMRQRLLAGLEHVGIVVNAQKAREQAPVKISKGKVDVWVVETDEQEWMFELVRRMIK